MLFSNAAETHLSSIDTASWMGQLNSDVKLNGIIIPGSHDAGMSQTAHCGAGAQFKPSLVKTQALSILQQLKAGSRYFDIRVDYDHGELVTYHRTGNAGCNGQTLTSVMDECVNFLQCNNSESLILKFSHIRVNRGEEREIKDRIDQFLCNLIYQPHIFTYTESDINLATISLSDCRGKIILVFDYPEYIRVQGGRFRYRDGFSKKIFPANSVACYGEPNIVVYDNYSNTNSLEKMKEDQLQKLDASGGLGREYFFLLSWTLTPNMQNLNTSLEKLAKEANTELEKVLVLRQPARPRPNIVYIDYFNATTARYIIQYNF